MLEFRPLCLLLAFTPLASTLIVQTARADDAVSVAPTPTAALVEPSAPEVAAGKHYQRGVALHREGQYTAALAEFERAYTLGKNPRILFTLGQVHFALKQYSRALVALSAYLEQTHDAPLERQTQVQRQLEFLRAKTGYIDLQLSVVGAKVSVDGKFEGLSPLPRPLLVDVGNHVVTATRAGYTTATARLNVESGRRTSTTLDLVALPRESSDTLSSSLWIVSGGLGALALAGAIATAVDSRSYSNARHTQQRGDPAQARQSLDAQRSRIHALAVTTDVLAGAALVSGAMALYVSWRSPDLEPATEARNTPSPAHRTHGMSVAISF